jgi:hypothetical protein
MTKKEAVADFMESRYPAVVKRYGADDTIALNEEWSYFTDSLCKDRQITSHQYESWATPNWPKRVMVIQ